MDNKENKMYRPTQAVLDNMERAIALKSKYNRNSIAAEATANVITKSKEYVEKGFTLDSVQDMYRVLSKLETTDLRKRLHDNGPSDDAIKFYAAGGSAGLAWSRLILKEEGIIKSFVKEPTQAAAEVLDDSTEGSMPVVKSLNEELQQVTYVAMQEGVDAHGDYTSLDEVRKAKESFNKSLQRANLFHQVMTDTFSVGESYLAPCDMVLNGHVVTKGTWMMTLEVTDPDIWSMIKSGELVGISIGAVAKVETIQE